MRKGLEVNCNSLAALQFANTLIWDLYLKTTQKMSKWTPGSNKTFLSPGGLRLKSKYTYTKIEVRYMLWCLLLFFSIKMQSLKLCLHIYLRRKSLHNQSFPLQATSSPSMHPTYTLHSIEYQYKSFKAQIHDE